MLSTYIKITKFEKVFLFTAVSIFFFGVFSAFMSRDWQYFERSGSLLVILAIWGFGSSHMDNLENRFAAEIRALREKIEKGEESEYDLAWQKSTLEKLAPPERFNKLRGRILRIEASVAVIGTLIWGYGSLLKYVWCINA